MINSNDLSIECLKAYKLILGALNVKMFLRIEN